MGLDISDTPKNRRLRVNRNICVTHFPLLVRGYVFFKWAVEVLPTSVSENITGRMAFWENSLEKHQMNKLRKNFDTDTPQEKQ